MNVSFKNGETINDYKVINKNGLSEYVFANDEYIICFRTDSGEGRNYSDIQWITYKKSNRQYRGRRYHYKFVSIVQGFSNVLYQRYKATNN